MKRISKGKFNKLQKLVNDHDMIDALAIDQRGSIVKMLTQGAEAVGKSYTTQMAYDFKKYVSQELSPLSSAMLIDQQLGMLGIEAKAKETGLIMSYEESGYDVDTPGRLPSLIPTQTAREMVEAGADALKVLIYYNPNDDDQVLKTKQAFVERYGDEALAMDVPIFMEIVTYDDQVGDADSAEFAAVKADLVTRSMAEFTKDKYHIDVLKLEVPFNPNYTEGMAPAGNQIVTTKADAIAAFKQMTAIATRPFIFLSAGVPTATFQAELKLAGEADTMFAGVLSGRATWIEGIDIFAKNGKDALIDWLDTTGKQNVRELTAILNQNAKPWYEVYGGKDQIEVFDQDIMTD